MAQIIAIVIAILGLCGHVSLSTVCWTVIVCEAIHIICQILLKKLNELTR